MKLTIVAATGRTGDHLLTQALAAGHDVTAVARRPHAVTADVRCIAVDLANPNPDALHCAVEGADAVLSGLGPRGRAEAGIASTGTRAIVAAIFMRRISTPMARVMLGHHFVDVAQMEDVLRRSGLDWTAARLPLLTDRPPRGHYRTAVETSVRNGLRIARADAARFMLRVLDRPDTIGHSVAIAY